MNLLAIGKRLILMVVVVFTAATLNFFLPKITGKNPILEKLAELAESGGFNGGNIEELMAVYEKKFGLGRPLWDQYLTYLYDTVHLDFGYSIMQYPTTVAELIGNSVIWTIGLMLTTTLIAFLIGTILGALTIWAKNSKFIQFSVPIIMVLAAMPFYLLGLVMVFFFAFKLQLFPLGGGFSMLTIPNWSWSFAGDVLYHATLPALSIILAATGVWALAMRGMMVTVQGEDYMTFAEAKGLNPTRIFLRYGVRNAMLPQITTLALALGQVITGAVLVEIVFSYPGLGNLLLQSVQSSDYFTIYGIVLILIFTIATATLILDLIYPLLDPRVRKGGH